MGEKRKTARNQAVFRRFGGEGETRTLAPVTRPTPLAGAPLRPLEYFSRAKSFGNDSLLMAERVGFEPTARFRVTGFQDRLLKPLGHLSTVVSRTACGMRVL